MKRAILTCGNATKTAPYLDALRSAGVDPTLATPQHPVESLEGTGLVLAGGADLGPTLYDAKLDPRTGELDPDRDLMEQRLLREALAANLPVLAICRGFQLFNVTDTGGTLTQHIEKHKLDPNETHSVEICEGTLLAKILGVGQHSVNSRHHQAVSLVGSGLKISAKTADGVIEGLERPDLRFAVAVQWHPEDMLAGFPIQLKLFEAFCEALV